MVPDSIWISRMFPIGTLQDYLNTTDSNMKFNENKFHHVVFSTTPILSDHSYFTPDGIPIESKSALRDFGVVLAQHCSFFCNTNHIYY